jgi:hypothetical protein
VDQAVELQLDRGADALVGVTDADRQDPPEEIQVRAAI